MTDADVENEPDFARELRGDDEEPMNVKHDGIIPAVIVGVILTLVNVFIARSAAQGDNTIAAIAELRTTVAQLNKQVEKLTEQPYVRESQFNALTDRVSGLDRRVDSLERTNDRQSGRR